MGEQDLDGIDAAGGGDGAGTRNNALPCVPDRSKNADNVGALRAQYGAVKMERGREKGRWKMGFREHNGSRQYSSLLVARISDIGSHWLKATTRVPMRSGPGCLGRRFGPLKWRQGNAARKGTSDSLGANHCLLHQHICQHTQSIGD